MTPIDRLSPILQSAKSTGKDRWLARCPSHNDKHPSLSIRQFDDGSVGIKCFTGCSTAEVLAAIGLHPSDLFPQSTLPADYPFQRPRPQAPPYREILAYLREDLLALSIGFAQLKRGSLLSQEDLDRLDVAALRCYAVATNSL